MPDPKTWYTKAEQADINSDDGSLKTQTLFLGICHCSADQPPFAPNNDLIKYLKKDDKMGYRAKKFDINYQPRLTIKA